MPWWWPRCWTRSRLKRTHGLNPRWRFWQRVGHARGLCPCESVDGWPMVEGRLNGGLVPTPLPGGHVAQYVRSLSGVVDPTKLIFTQFPGGAVNPWHQCPTAQFVIPMSGWWRVNTTDGDWLDRGPGHVLYQDDYVGLSVGGKSPKHYSSTIGGPCNQLVISAAGRTATVDDQTCDWVRQLVG